MNEVVLTESCGLGAPSAGSAAQIQSAEFRCQSLSARVYLPEFLCSSSARGVGLPTGEARVRPPHGHWNEWVSGWRVWLFWENLLRPWGEGMKEKHGFR
jgi:hypothetical protein